MKQKARVTVMLKKAILDPQGDAVKHALHGLGFSAIDDVRIGKIIELTVHHAALQTAEVQKLADQLLANPVTEDFIVELLNVEEQHV